MNVKYPNPKGGQDGRSSLSEQVSRFLPGDLSRIPEINFVNAVVSVPDPWTNLTLTNSWVAFNASNETPGYMKHPNGVVEVRGLVKNGTINTAIGTLPEGFRPAYNAQFAQTDNVGVTRMEIGSNGVILPQLATVNTMFTMRSSFLASDSQPQVLSCWPIEIKANLRKAPDGVIITGVKDLGSSDGKPIGRVHVDPYPEWEFIVSYGKPRLNIRNVTGLPYSRKYKLTFMVIGGQ